MERELYDAALRGNTKLLKEAQTKGVEEEYYLQQTSEKNNVIHIAIRREQSDFVETTLTTLPKQVVCKLICDKNCNGDNPFHVAAKVGSIKIVELLYKSWVTLGDQDNENKPWKAQNLEGNTPLHVALINGKVDVAKFFVEVDSYLARVTNDLEETPLHLAVKHQVDGNEELVFTTMKLLVNKREAVLTTKHSPTGDDLLPIIELLLKKDSSIAYWRDKKGLTPLLRASSLNKTAYLAVTKIILKHCPQCAELRDRFGKTILHLLNWISSYQQGKDLLRIPEIYDLRNHQDCEGNTPAHIAAMNKDIIMVQVLLELSADLNIKNKDGISAASMIHQHVISKIEETKGSVEGVRKLTEEECKAADESNMTYLKKTLDDLGMDFLLSRDSEGGNILHRLFQVRRRQSSLQSINTYDFIIPALELCPFLICQTDYKGDTPLHVLEKCRTNIFLEFRRVDANGRFLDPELNKDEKLTVNMFSDYFKKAQEMAGTQEFYHPPWRVKNEKGNTPLHEAVLANDIDMVRELLILEKELAGYVNNSNETPLHLLTKTNFNSVLWTRENENIIINKSHSAVYMRDKDGLTPFLRAARDGNLRLLELLGIHHPQVGIRDYNGKTFWHLLADLATIKDPYHDILDVPVKKLLDVERSDFKQFQTLYLADNDGNTPLHLAIKNEHFELAQLFLEYPVPRPEILYTPNAKGVKPRDLIAAAQHLPVDFEKFLWKHGSFLGTRSSYGIPTKELNNYAATLGLIAALLATITFTAGFTVPGGLNQDNGIPIYLKKAAFQVFMVSDILALCLSVMVLFCLLWILTTGSEEESVKLLDLSVFLLQSSFYTTLLAFMTGVYVTTFATIPWIAILSCALCSLLVLLMHKRFVMKLLIPCYTKTLMICHGIPGYVHDKLVCCPRNNANRNDGSSSRGALKAIFCG